MLYNGIRSIYIPEIYLGDSSLVRSLFRSLLQVVEDNEQTLAVDDAYAVIYQTLTYVKAIPDPANNGLR